MSYKSILQHVYETEKQQPNKLWLTQPLVGGKVVEYTWQKALQEARKMAQYLIDQNYEPGSKIAIVSKNCASFVIAELAIWMSGHTTVALYPTINEKTGSYILEHSEAKLIFVGKLDTWDEIQRAIPEDMPKIAMPQAPKTDFKKWREDLLKRGIASRRLLDLLFQWDGWDNRSRHRRNLWRRLAYTAERGNELCSCLAQFGIGAPLEYPAGAYLIPSYAPDSAPDSVRDRWDASARFVEAKLSCVMEPMCPPGLMERVVVAVFSDTSVQRMRPPRWKTGLQIKLAGVGEVRVALEPEDDFRPSGSRFLTRRLIARHPAHLFADFRVCAKRAQKASTTITPKPRPQQPAQRHTQGKQTQKGGGGLFNLARRNARSD